MGCEQILTFENGEEFEGQNNPMPNQQPNTNLLVRSYKGILSPEAKFKDTLIRSSDELGEKLRNYIPSQISEGDNKYKYNLYDDILTKSAKIDFDKEYIIAICGVNNVLRVEESNGNYVIYHDNQPKERNSYIALVVKKIPGINPNFEFASPKRI